MSACAGAVLADKPEDLAAKTGCETFLFDAWTGTDGRGDLFVIEAVESRDEEAVSYLSQYSRSLFGTYRPPCWQKDSKLPQDDRTLLDRLGPLTTDQFSVLVREGKLNSRLESSWPSHLGILNVKFRAFTPTNYIPSSKIEHDSVACCEYCTVQQVS